MTSDPGSIDGVIPDPPIPEPAVVGKTTLAIGNWLSGIVFGFPVYQLKILTL